MRIMFWNLDLGLKAHKKDKSNVSKNENLCRCIANVFNEGIQIGVFTEYDKFDFNQLLCRLDGQVIRYDGNEGCRRITLLAKKEWTVHVLRESSRFSTYSIYKGNIKYNIIGLHAEDKRNDPGGTKRRKLAEEIIRTVKEDNIKERLIILGDFNSYIFDLEMLEYDKYNCIFFKDIIKSNSYKEVDDVYYKRYYNPILDAIS